MRAYPTEGQARRAARMLRMHCDIYNAALQERRDAWRMNRVSISYGQQSAQLRDVRDVYPLATVICPVCGPLDADVNGAHNIATRAGTGSHLALTG